MLADLLVFQAHEHIKLLEQEIIKHIKVRGSSNIDIKIQHTDL